MIEDLQESDFRITFPSILSPAETHNVGKQLITAGEPIIPAAEDDPFRIQFTAFKQLQGLLGEALGLGGQVSNPYTPDKKGADTTRNRAWRRFRDAVQSIASDPEEDEAERAAAELLRDELNKFPSGIDRLPFPEKSAKLEALLLALAEEPLLGAVATLELTKFVTRMETGNAAFQTAVELADQFDVEIQEVESDWIAVRPVRWLGSHILSEIAFRGLTEEAYSNAAELVTEAITNAQATARSRRTRRESEVSSDVEISG